MKNKDYFKLPPVNIPLDERAAEWCLMITRDYPDMASDWPDMPEKKKHEGN